jgi:uncharacterized membrane protein
MKGLSHPAGKSSRASGISADGNTIVGFSEDPIGGYRRPVRWIAGKAELFAGAHAIGEASAVSFDGSQIVGQYTTSANGIFAFYYSQPARSGLARYRLRYRNRPEFRQRRR